MLNIFFNAKPKVYGIIYLLFIPVYATVFYFFSEAIFCTKYSVLECIYFSVVTITTLGYGEIIPKSDLGMIVTLSEPLFGVLFIGLFLNSLSRVRSETTRKEEIEKEKKSYRDAQVAKLIGHFRLIHPILEIFQQSVARITSPLVGGPYEYNPDFKLSDMKDLYHPSFFATRNMLDTAVKFYFDSFGDLKPEISDLIKLLDLRLFPELERSCLSFMQAGSPNYSESILVTVNMNVGGKPMTEFIKEELEKHDGEPEIVQGSPLNPYVEFYRQIKSQMESIEIIKTEAERITSAV